MELWTRNQRLLGATIALGMWGAATTALLALLPTGAPTTAAPPLPAATLSLSWAVSAPLAASPPLPQKTVLADNQTSAPEPPVQEQPSSAPQPDEPAFMRAQQNITPSAKPIAHPPQPRPKKTQRKARTTAPQFSPLSAASSASAPPESSPVDKTSALHDSPPSPPTASPLQDPSPATPLPFSPSEQPLAALCTYRTPPQYPYVARQMGAEGVVWVAVTLSPDGTIHTAVVDKNRSTTLHPALLRAALDAVRAWRCHVPPHLPSQPITLWQPFRFALTN